jgi:hypothetical protein
MRLIRDIRLPPNQSVAPVLFSFAKKPKSRGRAIGTSSTKTAGYRCTPKLSASGEDPKFSFTNLTFRGYFATTSWISKLAGSNKFQV